MSGAMPVENYVFTSESVSEGHPDKVCDRISDAILDAFLAREPEARVAVETLTTTNLIVLAGEVRPAGLVSNEEIEEIARAAVRDIGYEQDGFHWRDAEVQVRIHGQSAHIAQGVDQDGAGDQGIMFGYACRETPELMPAPIAYSHRILAEMAEARRTGSVAGFGPDSKSQISLRYENGRPVTATSVVVSTQHDAALSQDDVRVLVRPFVENVLPDDWMCDDDQFFVNPTGTFVIGGPDGDAGLTGRKIIVDTYGGAAPHGGGAFSGKDPTKVDRSAAYACRYLAKNLVAAGLAEKCTIQLAYAIGVAEPVSLFANTHGTGTIDNARLQDALSQSMNLTPRGIRQQLSLNAPVYAATAAYGHFGRVAGEAGPGSFSWEATDLVDDLRSALD